MERTGVGLRAPAGGRSGEAARHIVTSLRTAFGLYARLFLLRSIPTVASRTSAVDFTLFQANVELKAQKPTIRGRSTQDLQTDDLEYRVARRAFDYAVWKGRGRVTAIYNPETPRHF